MKKSTTAKTIAALFAKRATDAYKLSLQKSGEKHLKMKTLYSADGQLDMSVQASREHFCTPQTDEGPYTHVEVGFPSLKPPEAWKAFSMRGKYDTKPCDDVYGNVPLALVVEWLDSHGGLKAAEAPAAPIPPTPAPGSAKTAPNLAKSAPKPHRGPTAKDLGLEDLGGKE